jgi:hypothetical protein
MVQSLGVLIPFPVRRVCALGVPAGILDSVREELANVALSTDASTLQRSDLLVVGAGEPRAFDIIRWVRQTAPEFPILLWSADSAGASLAAHCRMLLFPDDHLAAGSETL